MSRPGESGESQSKCFTIKQACISELLLNGPLGPCPDKDYFLSCFGKHPDVSLKSFLVLGGLLR